MIQSVDSDSSNEAHSSTKVKDAAAASVMSMNADNIIVIDDDGDEPRCRIQQIQEVIGSTGRSISREVTDSTDNFNAYSKANCAQHDILQNASNPDDHLVATSTPCAMPRDLSADSKPSMVVTENNSVSSSLDSMQTVPVPPLPPLKVTHDFSIDKRPSGVEVHHAKKFPIETNFNSPTSIFENKYIRDQQGTNVGSNVDIPTIGKPTPRPVFEHILLLPPSHHTKEASLPSNYLTPEEEALQEEQLQYKNRRKRREKRKTPTIQKEDVDETYEVGRSGRIRKKPRIYSDYVMENLNQDEDVIVDDDDSHYRNLDLDYEDQEEDESDDSTIHSQDESSDDSLSPPPTPQKESRNRILYSHSSSGKMNWNEQVESLKQFKEIHGHTKISQRNSENPKLAKWVKKVREKYKKLQKGMVVPSLSKQRIDQLEKIGFIWSIRSADQSVGFNQHVADLVEYKRENGHTRVPHVYEKNPSLGRWVHHVRLSHKKIANNQKPMIQLTREQIEKLDEVGFQWKVRYLVATNKSDSSDNNFDENLERLKEFKRVNGNCQVIHGKGNDDLACWVNALKSSYRQIREGNTPIQKLSVDQIKQLDELQFNWTEQPVDTRHNNSTKVMLPWDERYNQLCDYKMKYGNCRVPSNYNDDRSFGNWVNIQRRALGAKSVGNSANLTDEQQEKLETLGLEYSVYAYKLEVGQEASKSQYYLKENHISNFEDRLHELKQFHAQHGHFMVPKENERLFSWMYNIRFSYHYRNYGNNGKNRAPNIVLTPERVKALNGIGFDFEKDLISRKRNTQEQVGEQGKTKRRKSGINQWMKRLNLGFDLINDTSSHQKQVPQSMFHTKIITQRQTSRGDMNFNHWMEKLNLGFILESSSIHSDKYGEQKQNRTSMSTSIISVTKKSQLSVQQDRTPCSDTLMNTATIASKNQVQSLPSMQFWLEELNIGFVFGMVKCNRNVSISTHSNERSSTSFESNLKALRAHKAQFGHINVSRKSNKVLHTWTQNLRTSYKRFQAGERTFINLSEDRMQSLASIGFEFKRNVGSYKTFEWYVQRLVEYKQKHGHINVKQREDKSLNAWISNIKTSYKRLREGRSLLIKLSEERIKSLVNIGFNFDTDTSNENSTVATNEAFDNRIAEFENSSNNDAGVEPTHTLTRHGPRKPFEINFNKPYSDPPLTSWLANLSLGFIFVVPDGAASGSNDDAGAEPANNLTRRGPRKPFEWYVQRLVEYKQKHGHINVKQREDKSLNAWISNIKTSYKRLREGRSPLIKLSEERIKSLVNIGFNFDTDTSNENSTVATNEAFDNRIAEFEHFVKIHGRMGVAKMKRMDQFHSLGNWCADVKTSYNKFINGEPQQGVKLSSERIEKLKSVGFDFSSTRGNSVIVRNGLIIL